MDTIIAVAVESFYVSVKEVLCRIRKNFLLEQSWPLQAQDY